MKVLEESEFVSYLVWFATRDEEFMEHFSELIEPQQFEVRELSYLLDRAVWYWQKYGETLDPEVLILELENRKPDRKFSKEAVADLYVEATQPTEKQRKYLFDYATKWFTKRDYMDLLADSVDLVGDGRVEEARAAMESNLAKLYPTEQTARVWDMAEDMDEVLAELAAQMSGDLDPRAIPVGLPSIDEALQGGLRNKELGVIMAPPGRGKTQALVHITRHAWRMNKNVLYISMEMSSKRLLARFYGGIAGVDSNKVYKDPALIAQAMKHTITQNRLTSKVRLIQYPQLSVTVSEIRRRMLELQKANAAPIDMLVVDYGDLVATERSAAVHERRDMAKAVYGDLRNLAIIHDIPVWTASQTNRGSLNKRTIVMSDIADSWDKVQIADYVIALCQTKEEEEAHYVRWLFAKNRNGEMIRGVGTSADYSMSKFVESDDNKPTHDDDND